MKTPRPIWCIAILASSGLAADPSIAGCPALPADNIWNAAIDRLPVDRQSDAYVATVGPTAPVHADLSIPFVTVAGSQPRVDITFQYGDESDPGPYPVPPDAPIEGGG